MKKVAFLIQHLIISSTMLLKNGGEFYTKDRWVVEQNTILFVFHNNNIVPCVLYVIQNATCQLILYCMGPKVRRKWSSMNWWHYFLYSAAAAKHLIDLSHSSLSPLTKIFLSFDFYDNNNNRKKLVKFFGLL